ncbi:MAG: 16S rRNA (guanine(527)-N(7))-methyltransferase RsmG [Candidatus Hydrothermia bacterium]
MKDLDNFFDVLAENGVKLNEKQKNLIEYYTDLILHFNRTIHLTSRSNTNFVILKNLFDSAVLKVFLPHFDSLVDLGAGAGFVGIVNKILNPSITLYLVEKNTRKSSFLSIVVKELGFDNVYIFQSDWKELILDADVAVSKASCGLSELIELMSNFLKPEGLLLHYSTRLTACPLVNKFYRYFSPYVSRPQYICVYINKVGDSGNVPRGT